MPRISKSELSFAKERIQKSRLEILNKFRKFEDEIHEFKGTDKLKGKSWDSAKQHFSEYLPISDGIFNALADFGERFEQYLSAFESEVGSPKNKLDTKDLEELNNRLKTVKASKAQVLEMMKSKITQSYVSGGYAGPVSQSFDNAMEDINKDIQVLEDYRNFESRHASDFSAVITIWDNIDTYLNRLQKEGNYDTSSHTYQTIDFSQEKFYKELSSYNASQENHYEIERIAVKTDHGYSYEYRMYKNGLYDSDATDKFNQLQKKAEMNQAKDFFREIVGINDYIRMVDGVDPLTGKKITNNEQAVSSLMFLLTVVTEATALKVLKNMKNGKSVLRNINLNEDTNILKSFGELPRTNLSKKVEDGLVSLPNGQRIDPSIYMSRSEINTHLSLFENGVVKIQSKENFNFAIKMYGADIGDPRTGTYVMPKFVAESAIKLADGNPRILEKLLGLEPNSLGEKPILLDIKNPANIRVPSGNESGAWQGYWQPGGFTSGGIPEAVVDAIKSDQYTVKNVFK